MRWIPGILLAAVTAFAADQSAPAPKPAANIPALTSVVNAATGQASFAPGTWVSVYGTDLAGSTRSWNANDFFQGQLPYILDSALVTFAGQRGFLSYISPGQINVLIPDFAFSNPVGVNVQAMFAQSGYQQITIGKYAPGLFTFTAKYPAAVHLDGSYLGPAGILSGVTTTPAKSGEIILLFGTGFGQTNPPSDYSRLITTPYPVAAPVTATVGGQNAQVAGYLIMPGLYQFNLTMPSLAPGDWPVTLSIGGQPTQTGMNLTVSQ